MCNCNNETLYYRGLELQYIFSLFLNKTKLSMVPLNFRSRWPKQEFIWDWKRLFWKASESFYRPNRTCRRSSTTSHRAVVVSCIS